MILSEIRRSSRIMTCTASVLSSMLANVRCPDSKIIDGDGVWAALKRNISNAAEWHDGTIFQDSELASYYSLVDERKSQQKPILGVEVVPLGWRRGIISTNLPY
ncbi:hypothetical protein SK128_008207, partial [Halocaridina rubra]